MLSMSDGDWKMSDGDWRRLLEAIKEGRCTPFLGAGVSSGVFPLARDIAKQWAEDRSYPLEDSEDLARVAQFVAVTEGDMEPKYEIRRKFQKLPPLDSTAPDEPHGVLADLPFPIYITTNYDDNMVKALISRRKAPKQELCRWNTYLQQYVPSIFDSEPQFNPTSSNPMVFHLHGHLNVPESLVIMEDDYLDFLVEMSKNQALLPARIRRAMAGSSLLFLGYSLTDWDFRILFRGIFSNLQMAVREKHLSVQLGHGHGKLTDTQLKEEAKRYLSKYFLRSNVHVYWGECSEFVLELRKRWMVFDHGS